MNMDVDVPQRARLASLPQALFNTDPEPAFDRLVRMAGRRFRTAYASISFLDGGRQWIKAAHGLPTGTLETKDSLCRLVVQHGQVVCAPDARTDERFASNPLVTGGPLVRFYASAPLITPDGVSVGALCIADTEPRWGLDTDAETDLVDLAALVMQELQLRAQTEQVQLEVQAKDHYAQTLKHALTVAETLLGITDLAELALPPTELALRAAGLLAAAMNVDWAGLSTVQCDLDHGDHATTVTAWHSAAGQDLAMRLSQAARRPSGGLLWQAASSPEVVLIDGPAHHPRPSSELVTAGAQSVLSVSLGRVGGHQLILTLARLDGLQVWTAQDREMIHTVSRSLRQVLASRVTALALESSRQQQILTLEAGPLVLWATDAQGVFTLSEGRGLWDAGLEPGAALGKEVAAMYGADSPVVGYVQRAIAGEKFQVMVKVKGRVFEASYQPVPGGSIGVAYDVTERVRAEQRERQARSQAEALIRLSLVLDTDQAAHVVAAEALEAVQPALHDAFSVLWHRQGEAFVPLVASGPVPDNFELARWPELPAAALARYDVLSGRQSFSDFADLPPTPKDLGLRGMAMLPLLLGQGEHDMLLQVGRIGAFERWTQDERQLLETTARILTAWAQRRLDRAQLEQSTRTDPLTGLGNRRAFDADLKTVLSTAARSGISVGLLSLDLDGLKLVNDCEGHARGDELLKAFAAALERTFRAGDLAYRLGGDEYVLILPHTSAADQDRLLHRVAEAVQQLHTAGFSTVGASAGLAYFPLDHRDPAALLALSDARMYQHKVEKSARVEAGN